MSAPRDYCPEKLKPGGCQLHNLHCGYPACNQPPNAPALSPEAGEPADLSTELQSFYMQLASRQKSVAEFFDDAALPSRPNVLPEPAALPQGEWQDMDSGLSWSGFNVYGDRASIKAVSDSIHDAGTVPALKARVREAEATLSAHLRTAPAAGDALGVPAAPSGSPLQPPSAASAAIVGAKTTMCGGCGETRPERRCLGCLHYFGDGDEWVLKYHATTPAWNRLSHKVWNLEKD